MLIFSSDVPEMQDMIYIYIYDMLGKTGSLS